MQYSYMTEGTCCREICLEIDDQKVKDVEFIGGCNGNLKAIALLVKDQPIDRVITMLEGITCGNQSTSCPDQLTKALIQAMERNQ